MVQVLGVHLQIDERRWEMGRELAPPIRRVVAAAVLSNPFAGSYVEDLSELIDASVPIGTELAQAAVAALGGQVHSYGKGAIVGLDGELEHAAALLHPALGTPLRDACGGGKAIIPSAKKRGGPGTTLDVPLHYKDAAFVRSHFDAIELRIGESPAPDQIVLAVAVSDGGRPLPRVGGLAVSEAKGEDGLR
ncbi:MAG: amino acid synthesis family protein [Acidimicrobiales bacterium]